MELQFASTSRHWMARWTQAGSDSGWSDSGWSDSGWSDSGWSEWSSIDRLEALYFIERGWSFTYVA